MPPFLHRSRVKEAPGSLSIPDAAARRTTPLPFAQALLSRKLDVQGICATHFGGPGSVRKEATRRES